MSRHCRSSIYLKEQLRSPGIHGVGFCNLACSGDVLPDVDAAYQSQWWLQFHKWEIPKYRLEDNLRLFALGKACKWLPNYEYVRNGTFVNLADLISWSPDCLMSG